MTAETTMLANRSEAGQPTGLQLLDELKATTDSIRSRQSATGDPGGQGIEALGSTTSPLQALSDAGFGFITDSVSFLETPLQQLQGNPGAITSSTEGFRAAGEQVSSISESYQQSTAPETSEWSGDAALKYVKTGSELVSGMAGLGQASITTAEAMDNAGKEVAKTHGEVTTLINKAVGEITTILTQAFASASATFGASIASAIPQAVGVAANYAGQIGEKLKNLLFSMKDLLGQVQTMADSVGKFTELLSTIKDQYEQGDESPGSKEGESPGNKEETPSGDQAGATSGHQSGDRTGYGPGGRPGGMPGDRPTDGPGSAPGDSAGDRPGNGPGAAPGDRVGDRQGNPEGSAPGREENHRPNGGPAGPSRGDPPNEQGEKPPSREHSPPGR